MNTIDKTATVNQLLSMTGLRHYLDLEGLTEIAINRPNEVWFDRGNSWERDALPNLSLNMCSNLAKALATFAGLTIPLGEANPVASVIFPDGERGKLLSPLPLKTALSA